MTTIIGTGEVGALHSREELEEMQRLPLQRKIQITTARIIEWYQHYDGKVYVAFSGGKDSTVLLDIVRRIYPDVPAVFSDTGLEFPEVREFVKSCENVTIVRPEMNFRKVIEVYGYPVVSKRVADTVEYGHSAGDFSPLANLMVHEVIQIGYELLLPINLISKIPSDGLCGKTDEDNLGFTYAHLDAYIMYGTSGIEEIDKKIASMHDHNLHKLNPMPAYGTTIF